MPSRTLSSRPATQIAALWSWYHGGAFRGYQSQLQGPTVEDTVRAAFRSVGLEKNPVASGRTDLGVHARMQVLSFRAPADVSLDELPSRLNAALASDDVGIALAKRAPNGFHAQWKASGKEYRYRIGAGVPWAWDVDVDPETLGRVLGKCVGTRDFQAFHEKSSSVRLRTIEEASVHARDDGRLDVRMVGDGFARYQVRYLVGGAVKVARGELSADEFSAGLQSGKSFAGFKAPAQGLILWNVRYPEDFDPFTGAERVAAAGVSGSAPFAA